jgi:hypothetical protein
VGTFQTYPTDGSPQWDSSAKRLQQQRRGSHRNNSCFVKRHVLWVLCFSAFINLCYLHAAIICLSVPFVLYPNLFPLTLSPSFYARFFYAFFFLFFFFCFKAYCQIMPLIFNLRFLIFGVTSSGWLISVP